MRQDEDTDENSQFKVLVDEKFRHYFVHYCISSSKYGNEFTNNVVKIETTIGVIILLLMKATKSSLYIYIMEVF